jgi:hypothetical protein
MRDARSKPVFENARQFFAKLQADLARRDQSEAFKCVQDYKAEMETLSGFPIRIEEGEFEDKVGARSQMAWKHGRDYHLITTRRGFAPELLSQPATSPKTHFARSAVHPPCGGSIMITSGSFGWTTLRGKVLLGWSIPTSSKSAG